MTEEEYNKHYHARQNGWWFCKFFLRKVDLFPGLVIVMSDLPRLGHKMLFTHKGEEHGPFIVVACTTVIDVDTPRENRANIDLSIDPSNGMVRMDLRGQGSSREG